LQDKKYLKGYLGSDGKDIAWDFIRAAMASVSNTSIIMMQVRCMQMIGTKAT
jgi:4-alpha-glucanotransferase